MDDDDILHSQSFQSFGSSKLPSRTVDVFHSIRIGVSTQRNYFPIVCRRWFQSPFQSQVWMNNNNSSSKKIEEDRERWKKKKKKKSMRITAYRKYNIAKEGTSSTPLPVKSFILLPRSILCPLKIFVASKSVPK